MANPGSFYRARAEFDGLNAQLELQLESFVAYARARRDALLEAFEKEAVHIDEVLAAETPIAFPEVSPFAIVNREMETLAQFQRTLYSAENLQVAVAAKSKSLASVELSLLKTDVISDPSALDNLAFRIACAAGHTEIVRLLLADQRVDPAAKENEAFREASKHNHAEVVRLLIADPRFDNAGAGLGVVLLQYSIGLGHAETFRVFLAEGARQGGPQSEKTQMLQGLLALECRLGHVDMVKLILAEDPHVDPAANDNEAIRAACTMGHAEIVRLLLADPRVDPSAADNEAIRQTCTRPAKFYLKLERTLKEEMHFEPTAFRIVRGEGHAEIVRLLLADPRVDPAAKDNEAIREASNGHFSKYIESIISLLLADPRVDPAANDNGAIRAACQYKHVEVVRLLLADPRVDPAARDNFAIIHACEKGYAEIVKLLLADPRVDPAERDNFAIIVACQNKHFEVVRLLLADPRVDPAANDNKAFLAACQNKHFEVVCLLLADPRINPAANDNEAFLAACRNEHVDVIRVLLADPRVDPAARNNLALRTAFLTDHMDVVLLLLADDRISPETKDSVALWMVCRNGKLDFVRTLIPSVDALERDFALRVARQFNQPKVVKFLKASIASSVGGKRTTRKRTTRKRTTRKRTTRKRTIRNSHTAN